MAELSVNSTTASTLFALVQAQKTLSISAERIQKGLRILGPTEGVAAFFDASGLSSRATRLLAIKERIADAAAATGGAVTSLNAIISKVGELKAQAQTARALTISTTVVGTVVASAAALITGTVAGVADTDSFDITYNGTTTTIVNNNNETFTSLAAQITAITGLTATVSDGTALTITAADGNDIIIANNSNTLATDLGLATSTNGSVASATAIETAETQFDVLRLQLNTLAGLATHNGTNLISVSPDSLTVSFNEDGTSSITIDGVASDATGLGITAVDSANGFNTETGIDTAIAELDTALTTLQATRAGFAAYDVVFDTRIQFTEDLITLLDEGRAQLTGVDLTAEQALSLATQTRIDLTLSGIGILLSDTALNNLLSVGFGAP